MIVCGVDECEDAARAALVASDLAASLDAPLLLLHVAPPPVLPERTLADWKDHLETEVEFDRAGHIATVLDPLEVNAAVSVMRVVEFGEPVEVLRAVATETGATHLVVGRRGRGAVEDVLVASTSGALARDAPCPVILVPSDVRTWIRPGARDAAIVCGVDGSDVAVAAARAAGELAGRLDARLVLAHADDDDPPPDDLAERAGVAVEVEYLTGRASEELLALGRREGAALLAVGSRGRGALAAAVLGSVSRALVQAADVPVLVVSPTAADR